MGQTSARPGRGWLGRGRRIGLAAVLAMMACGLTAGCAAATTPVAAGRPAAAGSRAGAPFVYVTGKGGTNEISQYATLGSGALRPLTPANVAAGEFPYDVAVSPNGTSAYAVDNVSATAGEVSQYTINPATGKLTPKSPRTVPAAGSPSGIIAIAPGGKNAYVPSGKAISEYRISPATGKLTPMPPSRVAGAGFPIGIKVAPDGRYLYIVSGIQCLAPKGSKGSKCTTSAKARKASTVSVFGISLVTGALSARPVQTMRTGLGPQMITIAPDGRSAYVVATIDNTIWQYNINLATGKLTPKSPARVAGGGAPHDLAVAPDGKNLYVITVHDDTIAQYAISPRTGALSTRPVSTARTVSAPEAIALSPNGKNAYVTSEHLGALSQFAISPVTGKITPLSPAIVTAPSHGSLGVAVTPDAGSAAKVTAPATAWHGSALTYTITITDQGGPASASAPSNQSVYRPYHAYSLCMRTHGAPFWPEPTAVSHGVFDPPYAYMITKRVLAREHGAGWQAALRHCAVLAIQGSPYTAAQMSKLRSQLDKLAACMRRHGIAKFPGPVLSPAGGGFPSPGTAVNSGSAQFAAAQRACWAQAPGSAGAEPSPAGIVVRGYFGAVNSASARPGKLYRQAQRYTKCMRIHGVTDFPAAKPGQHGSVVYPVNPPAGMLSSAGYDVAVRACLKAAIHGGSRRYRTLVLAALKRAGCMRSRGTPGFPSPATIDGGIHVPDITTPFVATHTAQFLASAKACKMTGRWQLTWWWQAGSVRL